MGNTFAMINTFFCAGQNRFHDDLLLLLKCSNIIQDIFDEASFIESNDSTIRAIPSFMYAGDGEKKVAREMNRKKKNKKARKNT